MRWNGLAIGRPIPGTTPFSRMLPKMDKSSLPWIRISANLQSYSMPLTPESCDSSISEFHSKQMFASVSSRRMAPNWPLVQS